MTDDEEDEDDVYISGKREKRPAWAKASENTTEITPIPFEHMDDLPAVYY